MIRDEVALHVIEAKAAKLPDLNPVNSCIYCRRRRPEVELTREHIIPDGIGGVLVLPEASCRECANIINPFEQKVIKANFGPTRRANGLSAKDKKRKKGYKSTQNFRFYKREIPSDEIQKSVDAGMPIGGHEEDFVEYYSDFVLLERYENPPGILEGRSLNFHNPQRVIAFIKPRDGGKNGPNTLSIMSELGRLERFLAKIAHGFAVATVGIDGFKPYLTDYILDKNPSRMGYLIGSYDTGCVDLLHRMALREVDALRIVPPMLTLSTFPVLLCEIHLFSYISTVCYQVVVGEQVPSIEQASCG